MPIVETRSSTDRIACPRCGHMNKDLCDLGLGDEAIAELECGECGKSFELSVRIERTYTGRANVETYPELRARNTAGEMVSYWRPAE